MSGGKYLSALHNYFQGRGEVHLLSWKEVCEGPPDALKWTAECKVGGEVFATGTAGQLRAAKDQAAQSACKKLGVSA